MVYSKIHGKSTRLYNQSRTCRYDQKKNGLSCKDSPWQKDEMWIVWSFDQVILQSYRDRLGAAGRPQLGQDAADMELGG